jgi:hypothetical protein
LPALLGRLLPGKYLASFSLIFTHATIRLQI